VYSSFKACTKSTSKHQSLQKSRCGGRNELRKKDTAPNMQSTNYSKGQHLSPSLSSPSTSKIPETEDKTKKARHNRSWLTSFHLAQGRVEFGSLVVVSVSSLLFLATNVSLYDSSWLASTTCRY
jgi:hypothetical protein